jgi:DNA-binding NarL/FixJ family response regulator
VSHPERCDVASITIVLVDDHPVIREGMRGLLAAVPDMSVVGEAADGLSAIELIKRLQPDVVVLDMIMPGVAGMKVLQEVMICSPHTRVIAFSRFDDDDYAWITLQNGAAAYVLKDSAADELVTAIREVMAGRRYLSSSLPSWIMAASLQENRPSSLPTASTLTEREREVLQLVSLGHTNARIAAELHLTQRTVAFHIHNLLEKLNATNRTEAVAIARRHGRLAEE